MREQSERIAGSLRGLGRLVAGPLERRQERARRLLLDSSEDVVRIDGKKLPARWLREYMAYDPAADLPGVRCPVLAITGAKDLQVDPEDVSRIGALVAAPSTARSADLTHVCGARPGRRACRPGPAPRARRRRAARPHRLVDRRGV